MSGLTADISGLRILNLDGLAAGAPGGPFYKFPEPWSSSTPVEFYWKPGFDILGSLFRKIGYPSSKLLTCLREHLEWSKDT
jgi:hypothetical protein